MGSLEHAQITGFLCRLCSKMHRSVIHIYGHEGTKHKLEQKINNYLPVTVTPTDLLPKTICKQCMTRVEQHHKLMETIAANHIKFQKLQNASSTSEVRRSIISRRRNLLSSSSPNSQSFSVSPSTSNNNSTTTSTSDSITMTGDDEPGSIVNEVSLSNSYTNTSSTTSFNTNNVSPVPVTNNNNNESMGNNDDEEISVNQSD